MLLVVDWILKMKITENQVTLWLNFKDEDNRKSSYPVTRDFRENVDGERLKKMEGQGTHDWY